MWMLSKCVHIAGVGFANRPCANVSQASRKLKSSGTNGSGTGNSGKIARRSTITLRPTPTTTSPCLCASRANSRSMRRKPSVAQPRKRKGQRRCHRGHAAFKNQQRRIGLMGVGQQHLGPVPSLRISTKHAGDHRDSTASTCARQPRIRLPEPLSSPWNHASVDSTIDQRHTDPIFSAKSAKKDGTQMQCFVPESITQEKAGCLRVIRPHPASLEFDDLLKV